MTLHHTNTAPESKYATHGVDTELFNSSRNLGISMTQIEAYPLFWIYKEMISARDIETIKAHLYYALEFYGPTCVAQFFKRCDRL